MQGAGRHAEYLSDPVDVREPPARWQSDDDGAHIAKRGLNVRGAPVVRSRGEPCVEQDGGEAARGVDGRPQRGGAVTLEEVGRIEPVGEVQSAWGVAAGGELPVDAFGGLLPGRVVVGGQEDAGIITADVGAE